MSAGTTPSRAVGFLCLSMTTRTAARSTAPRPSGALRSPTVALLPRPGAYRVSVFSARDDDEAHGIGKGYRPSLEVRVHATALHDNERQLTVNSARFNECKMRVEPSQYTVAAGADGAAEWRWTHPGHVNLLVCLYSDDHWGTELPRSWVRTRKVDAEHTVVGVQAPSRGTFYVQTLFNESATSNSYSGLTTHELVCKADVHQNEPATLTPLCDELGVKLVSHTDRFVPMSKNNTLEMTVSTAGGVRLLVRLHTAASIEAPSSNWSQIDDAWVSTWRDALQPSLVRISVVAPKTGVYGLKIFGARHDSNTYGFLAEMLLLADAQVVNSQPAHTFPSFFDYQMRLVSHPGDIFLDDATNTATVDIAVGRAASFTVNLTDESNKQNHSSHVRWEYDAQNDKLVHLQIAAPHSGEYKMIVFVGPPNATQMTAAVQYAVYALGDAQNSDFVRPHPKFSGTYHMRLLAPLTNLVRLRDSDAPFVLLHMTAPRTVELLLQVRDTSAAADERGDVTRVSCKLPDVRAAVRIPRPGTFRVTVFVRQSATQYEGMFTLDVQSQVPAAKAAAAAWPSSL